MRQGWCIGLRLLVQLRANNQLTQHSIDRSEFLPTGDYFSLAYLYSQDYKIYGYEMDKAPVK